MYLFICIPMCILHAHVAVCISRTPLSPAPPDTCTRMYPSEGVVHWCRKEILVLRMFVVLVHSFATTIFCYGQTGTGKTFTLSELGDHNTMGIIPRAVTEIFQRVETDQEHDYVIRMQMIQIYMEMVRCSLLRHFLCVPRCLEEKKWSVVCTMAPHSDARFSLPGACHASLGCPLSQRGFPRLFAHSCTIVYLSGVYYRFKIC